MQTYTKNKQLIRPLLIAPLLFVFLLWYFYNFRSTFIDDAFIQFQYAKTLVNDHVWGFYASYPANTATSPLNVLLTSFFAFFTGDVVNAAAWLAAIEFLAMFFVLARICTRLFDSSFAGIFPFVALLTNPLLLSTLGMETTLFALLLLVCLCLYLEKRWNILAVAAGFLTLARFDGSLFFVCLLIAVPEKRLRFLLIYAATLLPWHLWSWIYLGSFVPDTLIIKTAQKQWEENASFFQGLTRYYFPRFPFATSFSLLLTPFALLSLWSRSDAKKSVALLMGFVCFHFASYSLLGVPPYHWYYGPLTVCGIVSGCLAILSLFSERKHAVTAAIAVSFGMVLPFINEGFPLKEAPIHTNAATHEKYREIGVWIRQNTPNEARITLMGEIGTMGYYSERLIHTDFTIPAYVDKKLKTHRFMQVPVLRTLLRWNFYWRKESAIMGNRTHLLRHVAFAHEPFKKPNILKTWDTSTKWFPAGRMYFETIQKRRNSTKRND